MTQFYDVTETWKCLTAPREKSLSFNAAIAAATRSFQARSIAEGACLVQGAL